MSPLLKLQTVYRVPAGLRRGFTLVELLVVMAVAVVMLAMAGPRMADFTANNQLSALKSDLAGAVALARTEAAKRGLPVILTRVGSGPTGNEYAGGWELVGDDDSNGSADAGEPRLRAHAALASTLSLGGPTALGFRPTGALSAGSAQTFLLCRSGSSQGYLLTVAPSGVADVATSTGCSP
jgi:type IV fimbrial biogenesis protein FimT